jgi:hypothetical protein
MKQWQQKTTPKFKDFFAMARIVRAPWRMLHSKYSAMNLTSFLPFIFFFLYTAKSEPQACKTLLKNKCKIKENDGNVARVPHKIRRVGSIFPSKSQVHVVGIFLSISIPVFGEISLPRIPFELIRATSLERVRWFFTIHGESKNFVQYLILFYSEVAIIL